MLLNAVRDGSNNAHQTRAGGGARPCRFSHQSGTLGLARQSHIPYTDALHPEPRKAPSRNLLAGESMNITLLHACARQAAQLPTTLIRLAAPVLLLTLAIGTSLAACKGGAEEVEYGPDGEIMNLTPEERADQLIVEAKTQYDKGNFVDAHEYAHRVVANFFPDDIEAHLIKAWCNLQLRRYDDFRIGRTNVVLPGARNNLRVVLELSPNEFRGHQGLATLKFYEFRDHLLYARTFKATTQLIRQEQDNLATLEGMRTELQSLPQRDPSRIEKDRAFRDLQFNSLTNWRNLMTTWRESYAGKPFIFEDSLDANDPADAWKSWVHEDLVYDVVRKSIQDAELIEASANMSLVLRWMENRGTFWETSALNAASISQAKFLELKQRAPQYYFSDQDLYRLHYELGMFFLDKGMSVARAMAEKEAGWERVPESRKLEVISAYFADPASHTNPWREPVKREFGKAIEACKRFIDADRLSMLNKEENLETIKQEYMSLAAGQDVVVQDIRQLFVEEARSVIADQALRRQSYIRTLITLMTYNWSLNQDLYQAGIYVQELENANTKDPMPHFMRGIIYKKQGLWEDAIQSFKTFERLSSVATHYNRRQYAREQQAECEMEILKAKQDKAISGAFGE